jgi:methylmalonyl-CoA mutase cobalamin-binding domain/chain
MVTGSVVLTRAPARPIRVVVAKVGLDGHDVGARVVARGLMDAGMEVIYTGLRRTPEQVVTVALQEDSDVVGISILSGAHVTLVRRLATLMKERELDDVLLIVGGVIPDSDAPVLQELGVDAIFHPATTTDEIVSFIRENVRDA